MSTVPAVRVFILPAQSLGGLPDGRSGFSYPWSSNFVECKRLIPVGKSSTLPGGMGSASFRLLRQNRYEPAGGLVNSGDDNVVAGSYIAISIGGEYVWYGWITSISTEQLAQSEDQVGSVSASGLGALLDGTQIQGFKRVKSTAPTDDAGDPIGFPTDINVIPTMNLSISDSEIIGNCHVLAGTSPVNTVRPTLYGFADKDDQCGTGSEQVWNRWRALCHVVAFCTPLGIPKILVEAPASVIAALDDVSILETFDLDGLTMKGAIDLLVPRSRGYGWKLTPRDALHWVIEIYTHDFNGDYTQENAPIAIDISDLAVKSVGYVESATDAYDEIVIRGSPHVSCASYSIADDNIERGWTDQQQTDYTNGAMFATGYSTAEADERKERNRGVRNGPGLCDVYQHFIFKSRSSDGNVYTSAAPGYGLGSTVDIAAVPSIYWDGNHVTAYLFKENSKFPNIANAKILRTIPWPVGVKSNGIDERSESQKARLEYLSPRLFRVPADYGEDSTKWIDLIASGGEEEKKERGTPEISSDDRFGGFRVKYSPPEMLARNHWFSGPDEEDTDLLPDADDKERPIDYEDLVITVAVESDQYLEVKRRKPGIDNGPFGDALIRRRLTISIPKLKCWVVVNGAVIGVNGDGSPNSIAVTNSDIPTDTSGSVFVTRNDYPTAELYANMVAAWAFEKRKSLSISIAMSEELPAWANIGTMIGGVFDTSTVQCNTVVEAVSYDFNSQSPGIEISTTLPAMPQFNGGSVSNSPTAGGSISSALGGTVAQAVSKLQKEVLDIKRDTQKIPIIAQRGGIAGVQAETATTLYAYVARIQTYDSTVRSECSVFTILSGSADSIGDNFVASSPRTLGWISDELSIPPMEFGNHIYEVERVGTDEPDYGHGARKLYKVIRLHRLDIQTYDLPKALKVIAGGNPSIPDGYGTVTGTNGLPITTTQISGTKNNSIAFRNTSYIGATNTTFILPRPLQYDHLIYPQSSPSAVFAYPALTDLLWHSGRRANVNIPFSGGTMTYAIEMGERFSIRGTTSMQGFASNSLSNPIFTFEIECVRTPTQTVFGRNTGYQADVLYRTQATPCLMNSTVNGAASAFTFSTTIGNPEVTVANGLYFNGSKIADLRIQINYNAINSLITTINISQINVAANYTSKNIAFSVHGGG